MIFLTEYDREGFVFAGENIEADTWEEAEYEAHPDRRVIGILATEIEISEN